MFIALWMSLAGAADVLPLKRVRFYEVGVAWFERRGRIEESASLTLPTSHVDDALKTLMVLGGDAGVGAITFESRTEPDATREVAGVDLADLDYARSLQALVGEDVIITRGNQEVTGTLLNLSTLTRTEPSEEEAAVYLAPEYALTVLTHTGTLRRLRSTEVDAVRASDPAVLERVRAAAHTLSTTHPLRASTLDVQAWKSGDVRIGYLSESAVWRVTYRLSLPEDATHTEAGLQGWSLVHNDTSEDWNNVVVEMSNGKPDSFLYPLVAPRYEHRELRAPEDYLSPVPQLSQTTADAEWSPSHASYGRGSGGLGAGGSGYGSAGGIGSAVGSSIAPLLRTATPLQTPTQFIYRVQHPLDLPARHSALVPILQSDISARSATVLLPDSTDPRHGAWLHNDTRRTLPAGPIAVTAFRGLSGEAEIERLEPDATHMIWFGSELDMDISRMVMGTSTTPATLRWNGHTLTYTEHEQREERIHVRNRSGRPRALWLAMSLRASATLLSEQEEHIDRQHGWTWVVLPSAEGETSHSVVTGTPSTRTFRPEDVDAETWEDWAAAEIADADVLSDAAELRRTVDTLDEDDRRLKRELDDDAVSLASLRADLAAADGGSATLARRIAAIEGELKRAREKRTALSETRAELVESFKEILAPIAPME